MSPGSASPSGVRRFFKRVGHGVKKVFESPISRPSSPSPLETPSDPSARPTTSIEPRPGPSPRPSAQSQQLDVLPPPEPISSEPALTVSLPVTSGGQLANAESSSALALKKAGSDAWSGLKVALGLIEKSVDVFPPLKSAVGGFLEVIGIFESAARNQENYVELGKSLHSMVEEFEKHPGEDTSAKMSEALMAMASGLKKEMKHVEEQQQRSGSRRYIEARRDVEDVEGCHRRVEALCCELQNTALIQIWRKQERQQVLLEEQKALQEEQRVLQEQRQVETCLEKLNPAPQAKYDSDLSNVVGRRTCTPGTRQSILAEMREWADDPNGPKVYCLNGMAGTGKTTLAYSFCEEMRRARRLGANFFCSRGDPDSRDVSRIVPTIAHQLAQLLPSYRRALVQQIGEDNDIGKSNIKAQFEKLIRDPLCQVGADVPNNIVVAIDALDECDRRDGAQEILHALFLHARELPVKFFVTCRPEPGLFDTLQSRDEHYRSVLHLHDIEASFVKADIRRYLDDELAETSLSPGQLGRLAEQAGTLFIYAATAVRYIHPKIQQVNVHQRLENLLSMTPKSGTNKHRGIDDLYAAVLSAAFADDVLETWEQENIRLVLDTAICAREPMSVSTMAKLLEMNSEEDVILALQHLRSVLHVSQGTDLISTLHASFPDFMLDRKRSKDLCCDAAKHSRALALCCFSTMQRLLQFNICELESSFILDESIPDLARKTDNAISPELFYACRYWGAHLASAEAPNGVHFALDGFLSDRLLFWMEVMNLRRCITAGAQMLNQAHTWLLKSGGANDVLELALDASRFVTAFSSSPASRSTPHIYVSALAFWPETRPVRLRYSEQTRGLIRLDGAGMKGRDLSCLATWKTESGVSCVAHSPDGTRLVFGSYDNTIWVYDAHSGVLVAGPFKGHTDSVTSVAFSPDNAQIVSSSRDATICVWDAYSGVLVAGPFEGHTDWVKSVAFSPDGTRVVSSSDDKTIRVWDAHTGGPVARPFKEHTGWVNSVVFSSDGTRIASGSSDHSIRVWDAYSGLLVTGPFEGHTGSVKSVAFSADGTRIVSGSDDKTTRVWDARSGLLVAGPFEGHASSVLSVAFSPNSTHVVSGSGDNTIRVWDARSGLLVAGPFEGHTGSVRSVVFSPDGTRIFSGSGDNTIRVWDARSGLLVARPFEGHTGAVSCVAFSPDSTRIVSGSGDKTICVWDAHSGLLAAGPFEGHTNQVSSVAFSSDGSRIASGSYDRTIRVWDAYSGLPVAGPFEGHTSEVRSVAFSSDGARIASGSSDDTICVWDEHGGLLVAKPFGGIRRAIYSVAFSPDSTLIVSGSLYGTIRVWDAHSGHPIARPFQGHTKTVKSVVFSPSGTRIASGSDDKTIRVWDARSGDLVAGPFEGHTDLVNSTQFSPDGTRIVSGSRDHTIRVWDARSGHLVAGPFEGHTSSVTSVAFSSDGTRIVSGSRDNAIRVWSTNPLHVRDSGYCKDWIMDKAGMITTRERELLLCVPADLLTGVVFPQNKICISATGVFKPDFDDVLLGKEWTKCYKC